MPGTEFTATSRVPTRPLSYANKEKAYRKELLVDYTNGMIYVIDENGNEHSITQQVYEMLIANGDLAGDIQIELPGGVVVTIQEALTSILTDLDNIKNNIDEIKKIIDELLSEDGKIAIDASLIIQDATHRFLTDLQISNLQQKVSILERIVTINPADVSGTTAPYQCVKAVSGVNPDYPAPIVDIAYTNDVFADNESEEDEYYKLHRCIVSAENEVTIQFKQMPAKSFQIRFQIKVPGF